MLIHISIPAEELLNKIAKRRVGRAMGVLEDANCSDEVKSSIKQEIWDMKKDVKDILEEACYDKQDK